MVASHDDGHGGDDHGAASTHAAQDDHAQEDHSAAHDEHLLHQLQNRPWSALYVAAFFLFYDFTWCVGFLCDSKGSSGWLGSNVVSGHGRNYSLSCAWRDYYIRLFYPFGNAFQSYFSLDGC